MTDPLRILVTRRWPEAVERQLVETYGATLNVEDRPLDRAAFVAAMRDYDVICPTVSDRLPAEVIETPDRRVRLIANYGVGVDHIDLEACRRAGVAVSNTPGVLTDATADIALTLMLMATRRAGEGEREVRAGQWTGWRPTHLLGASLKGRLLGLIGFGRIAQATAERARAFGMEIAYYSRSRAAPEIEARIGARHFATLDALLAEADVLSLHVPGGAETRHLIDAAAIARMKPGAYLINTARGDVVDSEALAAALAERRIAGAGLDVYTGEPNVPAALTALENVVLLPHLGSATVETRTAMGMRALANVEAWAKGEALPDRVA